MTVGTLSQQPELSDVPKLPKFTNLDSFKLYLSCKTFDQYEAKVLSHLSFFPESDGEKKAQIINTPIDKKGNYIHEFCVENVKTASLAKDKIVDVVLVHGYGASLAFFVENFDGLTDNKRIRLHAIDMLGFSGSSKPPLPDSDHTSASDIMKVEDYFIDSIEKWRKEKGLSHFVLMGHSLGGYLTSCYYLKYGKDVVDKLVLISPVGLERNDFSLIGGYSRTEKALAKNKTVSLSEETEILNREAPKISREVTQSREETLATSGNGSGAGATSDSGSDLESNYSADNVSVFSENNDPDYVRVKMDQKRRLGVNSFLTYLWEKNFSPFSILRISGPFAPKLISRWSFNRFGSIEDSNKLLDLHNFSYKAFIGKASGEYAITKLLAPGVLPRLPLLDRMPKKMTVPSLWLYGENDWMSKRSGRRMVREINEENPLNDPNLAKFRLVERAGHHLYLDNVSEFNRLVTKFIL
ncbi:unnamed protein product [[Candida] boidinii]|uniref:Unnamed protein product n=1 Tax=Candida boidinii TaxID=5477 RepID=A0A9W6WI48_CANBO|nr:hypothetical protein B5S30_g55 [[Candida] boidinii]OWB82041.1 hypothetical protein B5S33_g662 [[Candida] boidinii]GME74466.1 unnamed protein product [[Candida] boidinii]GMG04820.1 unnamed protein product [[Candida] boidinii]